MLPLALIWNNAGQYDGLSGLLIIFFAPGKNSGGQAYEMDREWEKLTWGWFWSGSWVGYMLVENACTWRDESFLYLALCCLSTRGGGDVWADQRRSLGYRHRHIHAPWDSACVRNGNTCCFSFCNNCRITAHQPYGLKWNFMRFFFPEGILVTWILCRRDVIITSSVNLVRIIFSFSVVSQKNENRIKW